jgi:hypothetical protein
MQDKFLPSIRATQLHMIVLAYLGSQWTCWFFKSFYLESCVWLDRMDATKEHIRCNLLVQGYHWWRELDLCLWPWDKSTILPMEKSILAEVKMARQVRSKVKCILFFFCDIKWSAQKEFILAGQTVNCAYYCDVLWRLREKRRLRRELWRQKNWLLHHDTAPSHSSFFTRQFSPKITWLFVLHPPSSSNLAPCDFSLFPGWR